MYQSLDIVRNHGEANTHRSEVRVRSKGGLVYGLVRMSLGQAIGKRRVKTPQAMFGEIALRIAI